MENHESYKENLPEKKEDQELLSFFKEAKSLKYLHLVNQFSLPAIAEDMRDMLLYVRDGKTLIEIVTPKLNDIEARWQQLIEENKLPKDTEVALQDFSLQTQRLFEQMDTIKNSSNMSEEEREQIQDTTKRVIDAMDKVLALQIKES